MEKQSQSLHLYCHLMDEIKRRDFVIRSFLNGKTTTPFPITNIESIYLQIRKILEIIALGSLVAHKEQYSKHNDMFHKHYHAKKILRSIEKLNPNFYPKPTIKTPSELKDVVDELNDGTKDYMTLDNFFDLYSICGSLMHAENPFNAPKDISKHEANIKYWMNKIINLLNCHRIQLIDKNYFYLINMNGGIDSKANGNVFQRIK